MNAVVEDALDALERRRFFAAFNSRYRELREDEKEWNDVQAERATEAVGADGDEAHDHVDAAGRLIRLAPDRKMSD